MISTQRLYPENQAKTGKLSETPSSLLTLIESYMIELIAFLATNREKADPARVRDPRPGTKGVNFRATSG